MRPAGPGVHRRGWLVATACAVVLAGGCEQENAGTGDPLPAAIDDLPKTSEPVDLDPDDFTTEIDNPYWAMDPGTRWVYREVDEEGDELHVVVTGTTATKETVLREVIAVEGSRPCQCARPRDLRLLVRRFA